MPWFSTVKRTPSRACVNAPVRLPAPGNAPDTWPQSSDFTAALSPVFSAARLTDTKRPRLRSEEHTSELQSLMRISYAVFCLKKKKQNNNYTKARDSIQIIL